MTGPENSDLTALQSEIQRLLGRNLLHLQRYEALIKAFVASHELSGTFKTSDAEQAKRVEANARSTLGALVNEFLGSVMTTEDLDPEASDFDDEVDTPSISLKYEIKVTDGDYETIKKDLKALVELRNDMVHHFWLNHDLRSLEGCSKAKDVLNADFDQIERSYQNLSNLAGEMLKTRQRAAQLLETDVVRDLLVNGIASDGTIQGHAAGIVHALRNAFSALAIDGWASIAEAASWIAEHHPKQNPAKYHCNSWRHVVDTAPMFELRNLEINGQSIACFRERIKTH